MKTNGRPVAALVLAAALATTGTGVAAGEEVAPPADPRRYLYGPEPLRSAPAAGAPVIASLRAGEAVEVVRPSGPPVDADGVTAPWMEVRAGGKKGHLRSGMLADSFRLLDLDGDGREEIVLLRNRTWGVMDDTRPKHPSKLSLRVARDGVVVAETELPGTGEGGEEAWLVVEIEVIRPKGLTPAAAFVSLAFDFSGASSGLGQHFLLVTKDAIRPVLRLDHEVEKYGPTSTEYCERRSIFPGDKGGTPNVVRLEGHCYDGAMGPEGPGPLKSRTFARWTWNGTTFVAEPEVVKPVKKPKPPKKA